MGGPTCHVGSSLRSERAGRKSYLCWEPSACLCRWRAAHPQRPRCRHRICRGGTHRVTESLSVRRRSPTSAWARSMFSTRKTPARPASAKRLPELAEAAEAAADAEAAEVAAEAAAAAEAAQAAEVAEAAAAAAVCRGELAAGARRGHLPITLTDAGRHGRASARGQGRLTPVFDGLWDAGERAVHPAVRVYLR